MSTEELEKAVFAHGSSSYGKYLRIHPSKISENIKTHQRIMMR
jgi:hypothetical protein